MTRTHPLALAITSRLFAIAYRPAGEAVGQASPGVCPSAGDPAILALSLKIMEAANGD